MAEARIEWGGLGDTLQNQQQEIRRSVEGNNALYRKLLENGKPKEKTMLFQIAVTAKAEDEKLERVVVEIQSVVAKDLKAAERIAIKKVPDGVDLNDCTVLVRPFA